MEKGYHNKQEVTMADLGLSLGEVRYQPLELFAREGARLLLRIAMEEEVAEFLGRLPYERSQDSIKGYRNGHRERRARCAAGEVEVMVPRVSDTAEPFRSGILGAWQRHSQILDEVLPLLYLEGLSTRDFRRALQPLWGKSGLSKSTISRANHTLKDAFRVWRGRDLSSEDIAYLFLDGFYLGVRQGTGGKEAVLVAHGINQGGKRVVLHLSLGGRESTDSWKGVLHDLEDRGLKSPQLIISDGNPGLLRAICDIWPEVPRQRCVVHRTWNVLARVPKKRQAEVKRALHHVFHAACLEDAQAEAKHFLARYGREFPTATEVLAKHLGECLTFYRFPEHHWKNIRSTNALERAFKEVRRRTNVIGRFPTETAALAVVFGILEEEHLKWRQVKMRAEDIAWITEAVKSLDLEPIMTESLQAVAV
jgi:putative transposase